MGHGMIWSKRGIEWSYSGRVSGQEIIESQLGIYGDPRFDELKYQLIDLSSVDCFEVSEQDMKKVAHLDKAAARSNSKIRLAVVATSEQAIELLDQYTKYGGEKHWENAAFASRTAAEEWLGLSQI